MATYRTPGVYIEEISKLPPSVAAVDTAVPAFIGYTTKAEEPDGTDLTNVPRRITSLLEFERYFGTADDQVFELKIEQTRDGKDGPIAATNVTFQDPAKFPEIPTQILYYSMRLFFANGGGPAWILSLGKVPGTADAEAFKKALKVLEARDEPTILVFPDANRIADDDKHASVVDAALQQCHKLQDRFAVVDVREARSGATGNADGFRGKVTNDLELRKYGAAYFPYLRTRIPWITSDEKVTVKSHTIDGQGAAAAETVKDKTLDKIKQSHNAIYAEARRFVSQHSVTLPPSGAIAGVYARVDRSRGVWKAPANVSLMEVREPALPITDDLNDQLNVHQGGKSVNVIRSFTGKGTLVWGARTLAGNDNENKYVPVRRFLIFAQQSIKYAAEQFVFEPNDANTWVKVRSMIENFCTLQWRDGALAGAKPDDAFYVAVGLNQTMSAVDILEGKMIIEVGLAIVRPAEFIILQFVQKMQES